MDPAGGSSSVQHGIQLVSQGVKHGADVIQDVLGGGAGGAAGGKHRVRLANRSPRQPWARALLLSLVGAKCFPRSNCPFLTRVRWGSNDSSKLTCL